MIKIEITDSGVVDAFNRLIAFGGNPQNALKDIGETVVQFTKERFQKSADPYGNPWAPNSRVTLEALLRNKSGIFAPSFVRNSQLYSKQQGWRYTGDKKGYFKKDGTLTKKSQELMMGKKPLIGESKSLSTQFSYRVFCDSVVISSPIVYAAMQNFGGTKAEFPNLWGDIPARPFFPNVEQGLPDELSQQITDVLRIALQNAMARAALQITAMRTHPLSHAIT